MAKSDKENSNKDKFVATGEGVTIYDKNGKPITPKKKPEKKASMDKDTRIALIKLAHSHPKGSNERKSVLAALTQFLPKVVEYKGFRWNDFSVASDDGAFDDGGSEEEDARRDKALKILSRALSTENLKDVIKRKLLSQYTVATTLGVHTVDGVGFKVPSSVVSDVETTLMNSGWTPSREATVSRTALTHPDIDNWIVLCGFREGFVGFMPKR